MASTRPERRRGMTKGQIRAERRQRSSKRKARRRAIYFTVGGALAAVHFLALPVLNPKFLTGLLFNMGVLILLWPLFSSLVAGSRQWSWTGVLILGTRTPAFLFLFPLFLAFFRGPW